ncbi:MAG: metal ABC transporter permease [Lactobacillales bacterium]|jgi:zinc transport system permease protein|nr:metal ABC transporter permease [Lactobacillales bacterium]
MIEMLSYDFMQRALMAAVLMSLCAPLIGVFLVVRRQSILSDTLSHVSLAGVALGVVLGVRNIDLVTVLVVVVASLVLEVLRRWYHNYSEVAMMIMMAGGLSLAMVLISTNSAGSNINLDQYLFGSIVTVTSGQVWGLLAIAVVVLVLFALLRKVMYVVVYDEDTARIDGLPSAAISVVFNVIVGIVISMMIPIAGILLVSAVMILPALIGMKIGRGFNATMILSVIFGIIASVIGLVLSYELGSPTGATVTLALIAILVIVNIVWRIKKWINLR